MAELLLELYGEEIPPQLQIEARSQLKQFIENSFKENHLKYKDLTVYSSPTRITLYVKNLSEKIQIDSKEIKGPKFIKLFVELDFYQGSSLPSQLKNFPV